MRSYVLVPKFPFLGSTLLTLYPRYPSVTQLPTPSFTRLVPIPIRFALPTFVPHYVANRKGRRREWEGMTL